jgi:hypothetical protein
MAKRTKKKEEPKHVKKKVAAKSKTVAPKKPPPTLKRAKSRKPKKTGAPASRSRQLHNKKTPSVSALVAPDEHLSQEEKIESAKFSSGMGAPVVPVHTTDLNEDIDRLPPIHKPMVCLLPQKPGVIHGYWAFSPALLGAQNVKLRLARLQEGNVITLEEFSLNSERGHWYFHVNETVNPEAVFLEVGFYNAAGDFVTAFARALARIPNLTALRADERRAWLSLSKLRTLAFGDSSRTLASSGSISSHSLTRHHS